jgi:hypothetical protein
MDFTALISTKYKANIYGHFPAEYFPNRMNDVEKNGNISFAPVIKV